MPCFKNSLSYFDTAIRYTCKMFKKSTPGVNVIKLFTAENYGFSKLARDFVPGKPFQPSLMFCG